MPITPGCGTPVKETPGDVPGGGLPVAEVPDRLVRVREVLMQETAAVGGREDTGVAPALAGQRAGVAVLLGSGADVDDVHHEQVAGFRPLHPEGAGEGVSDMEGGRERVLGRFVVAYLSVEPVAAVDAEGLPRADGGHRRDVRVPAVVAEAVLAVEGAVGVQGEECVGHAARVGRFCGSRH